MGLGPSQLDGAPLDGSPTEQSASYLDVLDVYGQKVEIDGESRNMNCGDAECQASGASGAGEPAHARFRSSADSECSTAAPSEDEGDHDARALVHDAGTPLLDGVAEDAAEGLQFDPLPADLLRESTFLIFDWDDTLLPTSFIMDAIKICPPKCGTAALTGRNGPRRGHARVGGGCKLAKDFPCHEALQRHAELVERLLTAATGLARVAIVTSASRPWVFESAEQYLPGLDFAGLLKDLQIPVYYAHDHQRPEPTSLGLDYASACKHNAMAEFLLQASKDTSSFWNVISVGDSQAEKDAAKAVIRLHEHDVSSPSKCREQRPLCKTVKLMDDPSLKQLSKELELLTGQLECLACHNGNTDLCVIEPEDLRTQLDALLVE